MKDMKNSNPLSKGTGIIGKGNIAKNFEIVSMELFNYLESELISHTDMIVYIKLQQFYNPDYGYAFPSINQLMIRTRIGSKATIHRSLDNLEKVGLLKKSKSGGKNNVYVTYKPFDKEELYKLVPDRVKKLREDEAKMAKTTESDKARLQQAAQTIQKPQETLPEQLKEADLLPEEIILLHKLEKLQQFNKRTRV